MLIDLLIHNPNLVAKNGIDLLHNIVNALKIELDQNPVDAHRVLIETSVKEKNDIGVMVPLCVSVIPFDEKDHTVGGKTVYIYSVGDHFLCGYNDGVLGDSSTITKVVVEHFVKFLK